MYKISREYWFSAAHQLRGHPKCGRMHGHNYKVVVTLASTSIINGMVLDFNEMDTRIKPFIDQLDHRYIASVDNLQDNFSTRFITEAPDDHVAKLPIQYSTAENLARWFFRELQTSGLPVLSVEIWETHKSMAVYYVEE